MSTALLRTDPDPQEEPLAHEPAEEKDWRDYAFEAGVSLRNASRSDTHSLRRANLMAAQHQLRMALEELR